MTILEMDTEKSLCGSSLSPRKKNIVIDQDDSLLRKLSSLVSKRRENLTVIRELREKELV